MFAYFVLFLTVTSTPVEMSVAPFPSGLRVGELYFDFVKVGAGTFQMGTQGAEVNGVPPRGSCRSGEVEKHEGPRHLVTLLSFEISATEVTQELWAAVMDNNPSFFSGHKLPVENVSWDSIRKFLRRLNRRSDGYSYRLPTEAEWEFVSIAGVPENLDDSAWHARNANAKTHAVASKMPNGLGIYDLFGNVSEWVQDAYDPDYYSESPAEDPPGPASSGSKGLGILRGCGYASVPGCCRPSIRKAPRRYLLSKAVGFRLVRVQVD